MIVLMNMLFGFVGNAQKKKKPAEEEIKEAVISNISVKTLLKDTTKYLVYTQMVLTETPDIKLTETYTSQFNLGWAIASDYSIKEKLVFENPNPQKLLISSPSKGTIKIRFEVPVLPRPSAILFIEFTHKTSGKKYLIDHPLSFDTSLLSNRFAIKNQGDEDPSFVNFISLDQRFELWSIDGKAETMFMVQYDNKTEAALSPTSTVKPAKKDLNISLIRQFQTNKTISIAEEGLYYIVKDTANLSDGILFLGVDDRFPRHTQVENIVEPLKYISTKREAEEYLANGKEGLDLFLLKTFRGDKTTAKKFMSAYFNNVKEANLLFTNFKEGWKTDKGMIYSVLGSPNKIQRSKDRETWSYLQRDGYSEMMFTFNRRSHPLTNNNFELARYPEYQDFWYDRIDQWRKNDINSKPR